MRSLRKSNSWLSVRCRKSARHEIDRFGCESGSVRKQQYSVGKQQERRAKPVGCLLARWLGELAGCISGPGPGPGYLHPTVCDPIYVV